MLKLIFPFQVLLYNHKYSTELDFPVIKILPLSQTTGLEVFLDPIQFLQRQLSYTVLQKGQNSM